MKSKTLNCLAHTVPMSIMLLSLHAAQDAHAMHAANQGASCTARVGQCSYTL